MHATSSACYSSFLRWEEGEDVTWFAATVQLTWLVQLTEMSGSSNSGYFVCLLWKGCLNGSLVTNSTWKLTSIYSHFLSRLLYSCLLSRARVQSVCVSQQGPLVDFLTLWIQEMCAQVNIEYQPFRGVRLLEFGRLCVWSCECARFAFISTERAKTGEGEVRCNSEAWV